jgi:hypothetical protein
MAKINLNGKEVEAQVIGFSPMPGEPWVEYHLEDGAIMRCKMIMTRVFKTNERNDRGEVIYQCQYQCVQIVDEKP